MYAGSTTATMRPHTKKCQPELGRSGVVRHGNHCRRKQNTSLGGYREDTHIILENGFVSSRSKRTASWMLKDETHQRLVQILAGCYLTNQEVCLRKVGTRNSVADGLTKSVSQLVLQNRLTALKFELTELRHENVSIDMITDRSVHKESMNALRNLTPELGRKPKCCAHEFRDRSQKVKIVVNIVMDCSEKLEKSEKLKRLEQQEKLRSWRSWKTLHQSSCRAS